MEILSRREWMGIGSMATLSAAVIGSSMWPSVSAAGRDIRDDLLMPYKLPDLPYNPDALEPYLDARTLTIHHDKHHVGYVSGLNKTLEEIKSIRESGDYGTVQALSRKLAFHGSGHVLHSLYFANLAPKSPPPGGALLKAVKAQFGSVETMKQHLLAATNSVAGSGWGMLAYEPMGGRLLILQIEKHENQILCGAAPLLVIDVWEHAYYLKYQNNRAEYTRAIMNIINWKEIGERFNAAVR